MNQQEQYPPLTPTEVRGHFVRAIAALVFIGITMTAVIIAAAVAR